MAVASKSRQSPVSLVTLALLAAGGLLTLLASSISNGRIDALSLSNTSNVCIQRRQDPPAKVKDTLNNECYVTEMRKVHGTQDFESLFKAYLAKHKAIIKEEQSEEKRLESGLGIVQYCFKSLNPGTKTDFQYSLLQDCYDGLAK